MANDPHEDADDELKDSTLEQKSLSDETVERVKGEILFGVGYKRPPKEHQFKKGQSGNPKGRPKTRPLREGDSSANALALKQAERLVAVREGQEINQISAIEAVFRAQCAAACKGNAYAQKHIIERYDWAERERRQRIEERIEGWEAYIDEAREAIAKAERNGEPIPALLPHPDDVVIDRDKGVRFVGPISEEEAKRLEETCRMRDMLIMQDALDQRTADDAEYDKSLNAKPGTALLIALTFNNSVPDRFKLSDDLIEMRMLRYAGIAKRQLLKDLYRGWRSLGARPKRGQVLPPLHVGTRWLMLQCEVICALRDGHLDLDDPRTDLEAIVAKIQAAQLSADA